MFGDSLEYLQSIICLQIDTFWPKKSIAPLKFENFGNTQRKAIRMSMHPTEIFLLVMSIKIRKLALYSFSKILSNIN